MNNTLITNKTDTPIPVMHYKEMAALATTMAASRMFGMTTPQQILTLMAIAQAEGLHPAIAIRDYYIVDGKPALKADAMLARFQKSGGKIKWNEYTDTRCSATLVHPNGDSITIEWTIEMAKRAGMAGRNNWIKYPRQMLKARVISEGIRAIFPGANGGFYTPEEVQDFDNSPAEKTCITFDDEPKLITLEQRQEMFALLKDKGIINPEPIKEFLKTIIKKDVHNTADLTQEEGNQIIQSLKTPNSEK